MRLYDLFLYIDRYHLDNYISHTCSVLGYGVRVTNNPMTEMAQTDIFQDGIIQINIDVKSIEKMYAGSNNTFLVMGIVCTQDEAIQVFLEHELVHVILFTLEKRGVVKGGVHRHDSIFLDIANTLFSHMTTTHSIYRELANTMGPVEDTLNNCGKPGCSVMVFNNGKWQNYTVKGKRRTEYIRACDRKKCIGASIALIQCLS